MKNSYQAFFDAAKKAKQGSENVNSPVRKSKLNSQKSKVDQSTKSRKNVPLSQVKRKNNSRKPRQHFPVPAFIFTVVGFFFAGIGLTYPELYEETFAKVSIDWIGQTQAAEKSEAKNAGPKESEKEKTATQENKSSDENANLKKEWSEEEISHFNKLNDRKVELDHREAELNELERELHKQKKSIEERIKKLEELRMQIAKVLKEKVEVDQEKVGRLVDFYSNMKPQQAAQVISTLNEDLAVEILGQMKKKNAADIMNLLKPEKAQNLTEKFAGYKRR